MVVKTEQTGLEEILLRRRFSKHSDRMRIYVVILKVAF